jgi:hypothetical protein
MCVLQRVGIGWGALLSLPEQEGVNRWPNRGRAVAKHPAQRLKSPCSGGVVNECCYVKECGEG